MIRKLMMAAMIAAMMANPAIAENDPYKGKYCSSVPAKGCKTMAWEQRLTYCEETQGKDWDNCRGVNFPSRDDYCDGRMAPNNCEQMTSEHARIDYCESVYYDDRDNCHYVNNTPERPTPGEHTAFCKEIYWKDKACADSREYCGSIDYTGDDAICGPDTYED